MEGGPFRWNEWNLEHATKHGCSVSEIESVVRKELRANRQRRADDEKWMVTGRGQGDRFIQVVFVLDDDDTLYVIHAMPVTTRRRRPKK
jgi:uncharacterized DUF497 family protein